MIGKKEIYELLNDAQIPYESMEHEAVYTMEEMDCLGITKKGLSAKICFFGMQKGKSIIYFVCRRRERLS